MGGNVTGVTKSGKETRAAKIPLKEIGRKVFVNKITEFLKFLNKDFKKKFKTELWKDESQIANGFIFNGSTSFIMNQNYSDEEVIRYKPSAGDLDVAVPEYTKENLWHLLDSYDEKEIVPGITYMGSNKPTVSSVGGQINCIFVIEFEINGQKEKCPCQLDWEFLPFTETGIPTEWAKFSHSSSFDDCRTGVKAVHHKYLLRALAGGANIRSDIVVATPASTPENLTISKAANNINPRMLKFSVGKGLRFAYVPMLKDGAPVFYNKKQVFKAIAGSESKYETSVWQIFLMMMNPTDTAKAMKDGDEAKMWSFMGVVELIKKYCTKKQIQDTYERYVDLLWGIKPTRGQELEVGNSELDYKVKIGGYLKFIEAFGLPDESEKYCVPYYADYGKYGRGKKVSESALESFRSFLAINNYVQEYY